MNDDEDIVETSAENAVTSVSYYVSYIPDKVPAFRFGLVEWIAFTFLVLLYIHAAIQILNGQLP